MFKKSLALFVRQLGRCAYELNGRPLVYLITRHLRVPNFSESLRAIKPISVSSRTYAKSRDIKKDKKKKVVINEDDLAEVVDVEKLKQDFGKAVEYFKTQLVEHASLRSSQAAIESLKIEFEGTTYVLQDLARVGKKSARMYVLDFADFPQTIQAAMEVLQKSELNINAQQDGTKVFIPIPKITKENRELLAKKCKVYFNNCKDTLRDIQNKYLRNLKKLEGISSDLQHRVQEQLYALTDVYAKQAEEILKAKQADLLKEEKS